MSLSVTIFFNLTFSGSVTKGSSIRLLILSIWLAVAFSSPGLIRTDTSAALTISSAEAILPFTASPANASALPTAEVSAFSSADVLFTWLEPIISCAWPMNFLSWMVTTDDWWLLMTDDYWRLMTTDGWWLLMTRKRLMLEKGIVLLIKRSRC